MRLEHEHLSAADFARRLREDEARLIDCLRPLGANQGVIGYRAGRGLKRMPSDIYWGSLRAWGIGRHPLSLAEYGAQAASRGRFQPERDDDGNATERGMSMWTAIPPPPEGPAKIERLMPVMPFSREAATLPRLRKTLASYRLAFGQPRQEELVELLGTGRSDEELMRLTERLRIDLSPPE